jgi:hypothetical protein
MPRIRSSLSLLVMACLSACGRPTGPQSSKDFAIPINLRCTTCDDFIRCSSLDAIPDSVTGGRDSVVYRLKEKTFWAQIATIADYLTQLVRDQTTDARPLAIYREHVGVRTMEHDRDWRAQIDVLTARITVLDHAIDQRRGDWLDAADHKIGHCSVLPRRDGYALVRRFLGQAALSTDTAIGDAVR